MKALQPMHAPFTPHDTAPVAKRSPELRSKLANGSKLLPLTDGRSATARRFRDLVEDIGADLGGLDLLSESEKQLIRRGALLAAESERQEAIWARQHDGREPVEGEKFDITAYSVMVNCQRRIFEVLGIKRRPRDAMDLEGYMTAKGFGQGEPEAAE